MPGNSPGHPGTHQADTNRAQNWQRLHPRSGMSDLNVKIGLTET